MGVTLGSLRSLNVTRRSLETLGLLDVPWGLPGSPEATLGSLESFGSLDDTLRSPGLLEATLRSPLSLGLLGVTLESSGSMELSIACSTACGTACFLYSVARLDEEAELSNQSITALFAVRIRKAEVAGFRALFQRVAVS